MAHGKKKVGTYATHGSRLTRKLTVQLGGERGSGVNKKVLEVPRGMDLVQSPLSPYTAAVSFRKRGPKGNRVSDLTALRLGPRRGHEPIEKSKRGEGPPRLKESRFPSQQCKQAADYRKPKAKVEAPPAPKVGGKEVSS